MFRFSRLSISLLAMVLESVATATSAVVAPRRFEMRENDVWLVELRPL